MVQLYRGDVLTTVNCLTRGLLKPRRRAKQVVGTAPLAGAAATRLSGSSFAEVTALSGGAAPKLRRRTLRSPAGEATTLAVTPALRRRSGLDRGRSLQY